MVWNADRMGDATHGGRKHRCLRRAGLSVLAMAVAGATLGVGITGCGSDSLDSDDSPPEAGPSGRGVVVSVTNSGADNFTCHQNWNERGGMFKNYPLEVGGTLRLGPRGDNDRAAWDFDCFGSDPKWEASVNVQNPPIGAPKLWVTTRVDGRYDTGGNRFFEDEEWRYHGAGFAVAVKRLTDSVDDKRFELEFERTPATSFRQLLTVTNRDLDALECAGEVLSVTGLVAPVKRETLVGGDAATWDTLVPRTDTGSVQCQLGRDALARIEVRKPGTGKVAQLAVHGLFGMDFREMKKGEVRRKVVGDARVNVLREEQGDLSFSVEFSRVHDKELRAVVYDYPRYEELRCRDLAEDTVFETGYAVLTSRGLPGKPGVRCGRGELPLFSIRVTESGDVRLWESAAGEHTVPMADKALREAVEVHLGGTTFLLRKFLDHVTVRVERK